MHAVNILPHVHLYQYAYKFEWDRTYVYHYNRFAYDDLYGFLLRCTHIPVFSKVVECLYMSIADMHVIDGFICVCFQARDWNIHMYSQLRSMISRVYKTPLFTSSATKPFKRELFIHKVVVIVYKWWKESKIGLMRTLSDLYIY
jgi:hypothetical protein